MSRTAAELRFLGGVGTVTGSRTLVEWTHTKLLVDCGLYQGYKQLRLRNWAAPPFDPAQLDGVFLTHAHIDHSGYLPVLIRRGYTGPIYATKTTAELCTILLPDAAYLQEEEARRANQHDYSQHDPALPLFTMKDAHTAITQLEIVEEGAVVTPKHGCRVQFLPAGHIPGASMIQISGDHPTTLFSGDLGRPDDPLVPPPGSVDGVKNLIVESTYGGRKHPELDPEEQLAAVVNRTIERKGKVLIPAFAVGRTQRVLYHLYRLISSGRIPRVPVYLNSPLAAAATEVFRRYTSDPEALAAIDIAKPVESIEASIHLNYLKEPAIIIAGSGMATGGRIVHHIKSYGPDRRNTILLTGYQAAGTRGARLQKGATELKMFGIYVPIEAEVAQLHNLSAHADGDEILDWLRTFPRAPRQTWINHGSPEASDRLRQRIVEELGWRVHVPHYLETVSVNSL